MHAEVGRIGFLPEVMAVYRKHAAGMWATYATELARHKKLGNAEIAFFRKLRGHLAALRVGLRGVAEGDLPPAGRGLSRRGGRPEPRAADRGQSRHRRIGCPGRYMGLDAPDDLSGEAGALRAWLLEQLTVSVIVTAYNHAADIGRCLDAILRQRGLFRCRW